MAQDMTPLGGRQSTPAEEKPDSAIARLRRWLIDSYNGIFKIVVQPNLPSSKTTLLLVTAFIFGMIWAYVIAPVQFYNAAPSQLSPGQRDQYIILVAGSYQAGLYDDANTRELLNRVEDPAGNIARLMQQETGQVQAALEGVQPLAQGLGGTPAPQAGNIVNSILQWVVAVIVFVIVANVVSLVWGLLIGGFVERALNRLKPETEADRRAKVAIGEIRRRKELEEQMKAETAATASDLGAPLMQRVSTYTPGRVYDDSFAIEDQNDMFLGECGATIAKTIGDSQEPTAFEVWLFDKEDFVRTLTKIFCSEHAFNDPVIRSELEPKVEDPANDIVMVQPGAVMILETDNIRLQAKISDFEYGTDGVLPPNSYFTNLTMPMMAWQKAGEPIPAAAAAPSAPSSSGLPSLDSYEIGPPPEMPSGQSFPSSPTQPHQPQQPPPTSAPPGGTSEGGPERRPLSPPPMQQPPPQSMPGQSQQQERDEDDDPFGGTGDFTPIGG